MKWTTAAIVLLDPNDDVILRDATAWKQRYAIPDHLCFTAPLKTGYSLKGYRPLTPGCLSFSDLETKIIVISHGLPTGIVINGRLSSARTVTDWLAQWGLGQVGLLTFRGCWLGAGTFLDEMAARLTKCGIAAGWLLGYKYAVSQVGFTAHECSGDADWRLRCRTKGRSKFPDSERVKIVQGNCDVVPPTGPSRRYPLFETLV